jgi:hypothetical protein
VVANPTDSWSFVYVTDKEPTDSELTDLLVADVSGVNEEDQEFLHKRRYFLTLPGDLDQYTTYYTYADAPASMKMTWSDLSGYVNDKRE